MRVSRAGAANGFVRAALLVVLPGFAHAQPTVTYDVATESNAGMDGCIAWESVFLINDGRVASFGTGNHQPEQSNAMRIIDPVTVAASVSAYDLFPWTQDGSGNNLYVSNYDNHPSIYLPPENKVVWAGHGVFDFDLETWTYGDRPPSTQEWTAFLDDPSGGMWSTYNPAVAWCADLDVGVWFGASGGGYGRESNDLSLVERSGTTPPWKVTFTNMGAEGVEGISYARNTAVCVGEYLYVGGPLTYPPGNAFYKIHIPTRTRAATLTPYPEVSGEYFPQMVYDSARRHIVVLGKRVFDYDPAVDQWTDVTPSGWPGYVSVMGVYHPALRAIFFRGTPDVAFDDCFQWHRMEFAGGSGPVPAPPSGLTVQ